VSEGEKEVSSWVMTVVGEPPLMRAFVARHLRRNFWGIILRGYMRSGVEGGRNVDSGRGGFKWLWIFQDWRRVGAARRGVRASRRRERQEGP
jgi:hypothetical protein